MFYSSMNSLSAINFSHPSMRNVIATQTHTYLRIPMSINCLEFRSLLFMLNKKKFTSKFVYNWTECSVRVLVRTFLFLLFLTFTYHIYQDQNRTHRENRERHDNITMLISMMMILNRILIVCFLAIIFPFSALSLMSVAFILFTFSIELSVLAVKLWCLLSLSSICSRSIRICNNKWLLDFRSNTSSEREKERDSERKSKKGERSTVQLC